MAGACELSGSEGAAPDAAKQIRSLFLPGKLEAGFVRCERLVHVPFALERPGALEVPVDEPPPEEVHQSASRGRFESWSASSSDNLLEVGERIWNLERKYNMDAGFTGKDDTLPARLLKDAAKTGPAEGKVNGLDIMLPEYYQARGWTEDGVPSNETLEMLAL